MVQGCPVFVLLPVAVRLRAVLLPPNPLKGEFVSYHYRPVSLSLSKT